MSKRPYTSLSLSQRKKRVKAQTDEDMKRLDEENDFFEEGENSVEDNEFSENDSSEKDSSEEENLQEESESNNPLQDIQQKKNDTLNETSDMQVNLDNSLANNEKELIETLEILLGNFVVCENDVEDTEFYEEFYSSDSDLSSESNSDIESDYEGKASCKTEMRIAVKQGVASS